MTKAQRAYSVGKAAKLLNVRPETVRRWCVVGKLAHTVTPGGHRRVDAEAIDVMVAQMTASVPRKAA